MTKPEMAARYAINIANDNSHGYSQKWRWPEEGNSFDCSSLVISSYEYGAGVPVRSVGGASYTGNMYTGFRKCGFSDVTNQVGLSSGEGFKVGDVLLNHAAHTVIYIGDGKVVNARSGEGTGEINQTDDSKNEIRIQSYWNYPWDSILRLEDSEETEDVIPEPDIPDEVLCIVDDGDEPTIVPAEPINCSGVDEGREPEVHICRPSEYSWFVFAMQYLLKANNYWPQADGYFALDTSKWFLQFQKDRGLEQDCQCGYFSWNELFQTKTVRITDDGFAVRAMQYLLRAQDYYIEPDGVFGPAAYNQLIKFQTSRGLYPSGICDLDTWNELIKR